jgi:hypothetical protein
LHSDIEWIHGAIVLPECVRNFVIALEL